MPATDSVRLEAYETTRNSDISSINARTAPSDNRRRFWHRREPSW